MKLGLCLNLLLSFIYGFRRAVSACFDLAVYYRAIPVVVLVVFKYFAFKLKGYGRLGMQST